MRNPLCPLPEPFNPHREALHTAYNHPLLPWERAPYNPTVHPTHPHLPSEMANPRIVSAITYAFPTLCIRIPTPTGLISECYNLYEGADVQQALRHLAPQRGILGGACERWAERSGQGADGKFEDKLRAVDEMVLVLGKLLAPAGSG